MIVIVVVILIVMVVLAIVVVIIFVNSLFTQVSDPVSTPPPEIRFTKRGNSGVPPFHLVDFGSSVAKLCRASSRMTSMDMLR